VHLVIIEQHVTSTWYKTNPEKYGVGFIMLSMFGIDLFGFILLVIDDWQLEIAIDASQHLP